MKETTKYPWDVEKAHYTYQPAANRRLQVHDFLSDDSIEMDQLNERQHSGGLSSALDYVFDKILRAITLKYVITGLIDFNIEYREESMRRLFNEGYLNGDVENFIKFSINTLPKTVSKQIYKDLDNKLIRHINHLNDLKQELEKE